MAIAQKDCKKIDLMMQIHLFVPTKADEIEEFLDMNLKQGCKKCIFYIGNINNEILEKIQKELEKRYKAVGWNGILLDKCGNANKIVVKVW